MSSEIYYFSGSGNSFVVARDIAKKINARLVPVSSLVNTDSISTDANTIGFVFPLYDFKAPVFMEEFIRKFRDLSGKYIYSVCTYGITPLKAVRQFEKLIMDRGGELSAGFTVKMPHNGIGSGLFTPAQHEKMFAAWNKKKDVVSEYILSGRKGKMERSNIFFSLVLSGLFVRMAPLLVKLWIHVAKYRWGSLKFVATEQCNGCELCKKICIMDNIEITDKKPVWADRCASCFACINWCPENAIRLGSANLGLKQYRHPEAKRTDIKK